MEGIEEFRSRGGHEEHTVEWTADRFIQLQKDVMNGGAKEAVEVLNHMDDINVDQVDTGDFTLDSITDLIRMALYKVNTNVLFSSLQSTLLRLLSPPIPSSIKMKLIQRFISDKITVQSLLGGPGLATAVALARNLQEDQLTEGICTLIGPLVTKNEILIELKYQLEKESMRLPVYQAIGEALSLGIYSDTMQPFFDQLHKDLTSSDYLLQMTSFDVLSDMVIKCSPSISQELIDQFGRDVYGMMESSRDSPDGGFVFGGAQKCLCELISHNPSSISLFPQLFPSVVQQVLNFSYLDAIQRIRSFELFTLLARSNEGKTILLSEEYQSKTIDCLQKYPLALSSSPVEMKSRLVESLAFLFKEGNESNKEAFFRGIGLSFAATTVELAKRPFPELKGAVYELWMNLLDCSFGSRLLLGTPEFISWLLPYSGNTWSDSQAWKDICERLLQYDQIESVMAERIKRALHDHSNPHALPQVATQM